MAARSMRSSTLEETLLTFWPPAPPARTALKRMASPGMRTEAVTWMGSAMPRSYRHRPGAYRIASMGLSRMARKAG